MLIPYFGAGVGVHRPEFVIVPPLNCLQMGNGGCKSGAKKCKLEPVYSNTDLTGHRRRRFRTTTVIYPLDHTFLMQTVDYMKRRLRQVLILVPNITKGHMEARICLKHLRPAGALALPEVEPLKTNLIKAKQLVLSADRPSELAAQPHLATIALNGPRWGSIVAVFVKFKMYVSLTV